MTPRGAHLLLQTRTSSTRPRTPEFLIHRPVLRSRLRGRICSTVVQHAGHNKGAGLGDDPLIHDEWIVGRHNALHCSGTFQFAGRCSAPARSLYHRETEKRVHSFDGDTQTAHLSPGFADSRAENAATVGDQVKSIKRVGVS
jgi:hypothetical protein